MAADLGSVNALHLRECRSPLRLLHSLGALQPYASPPDWLGWSG